MGSCCCLRMDIYNSFSRASVILTLIRLKDSISLLLIILPQQQPFLPHSKTFPISFDIVVTVERALHCKIVCLGRYPCWRVAIIIWRKINTSDDVSINGRPNMQHSSESDSCIPHHGRASTYKNTIFKSISL
jgi:hypothetical protein